MLKSKTIDRLCCLALIVMLLLTAAVWTGKAASGKQGLLSVGYEQLFSQDVVHTIDIEMGSWDDFIAGAMQEEYTECSVTIDGEKVTHAGIRGKGNTSLSSVSSSGSRKYSFKIEFDQFVKGRSYHGLDKLSLNNLIYDATMMKDYLAYTLMNRMGVPSPLCSFVQVTVNGEDWGLYLAVEGVENGFLQRNNMTSGALYKPDSMNFGGGRGNGRDFNFEQFLTPEDGSGSAPIESDPSGRRDAFPSFGEGNQQGGFRFPGGMGGAFSAQEGEAPAGDRDAGPAAQGFGGMFNFGRGGSDVKLQYLGDDPANYGNIFANAKTAIGDREKTRLIEALETLGGEHPEEAVFSDEVIRYLAVNDFLQNDDSYTGMMVHNYYLYEENGRLAIIPWDYNLAFGTMTGGGNASSAVNSPIDSPVTNGTGSDRPLVDWILSDETALAQYHQAYGQLIAETVESGWLEAEISRVSALIRPFVEADQNGFYTVDQFDTAVGTLKMYCALRGQSVRGQLEGSIPSTSAGQRADSSSLVRTDGLNLSAMGTMSMGGMNRGGAFGQGDRNRWMAGGFQGFAGWNEGRQPSAESNLGAAAAQDEGTPPQPQQRGRENSAVAGGWWTENTNTQNSFRQNEPSSGLSWADFTVYAAVLAAAILLVKLIPGRNR